MFQEFCDFLSIESPVYIDHYLVCYLEYLNTMLICPLCTDIILQVLLDNICFSVVLIL